MLGRRDELRERFAPDDHCAIPRHVNRLRHQDDEALEGLHVPKSDRALLHPKKVFLVFNKFRRPVKFVIRPAIGQLADEIFPSPDGHHGRQHRGHNFAPLTLNGMCVGCTHSYCRPARLTSARVIRRSPCAGASMFTLNSTLKTAAFAGIRLKAAYPQALSSIEARTPA